MKYLLVLLLFSCTKYPEYKIQGQINDQNAIITTNNKMAGAIYSLTWGGKEFLTSYDHGQELQSALTYDEMGENNNPTEAGNYYDTDISSSLLLNISTFNNVLITGQYMAYWKPIGRTTLSDTFFYKRVSLNETLTNVIDYSVVFTIPQQHNQAIIELVTGYLQPEFNSFYAYTNGQLQLLQSEIPHGGSTSPNALVLATIDGKYAMGIFTPYFNNLANGYYAFTDYAETEKWTLITVLNQVLPGTYSYNVYITVGTLAQVTQTMQDMITLQ